MSHRPDKEEIDLQYEAERTEPGKSPSVMPYLAVLVVAAFLLLLMAYIMQQRSNEAAINSLQQTSNSAVQSLENLMEERDALKEQVADLEARLEALQTSAQQVQAQQEEALAQHTQQEQALSAQVEALNRLGQLRSLYNAGRYREARALLADWPEAEETLEAARQSMDEETLAVYDPLALYQQIAKRLS